MDKKTFVLDTNVILHDSNCLNSFGENDIAIPIQVLSEIDKFKKGDDPINYNAREFSRFLDGLDSALVFDGGASRGKGLGKIRIILNFEYHQAVRKIYPEKTIDHEIINAAYSLWKSGSHKVVFISKDVNLRMKAKSLEMDAQDYQFDSVPDVKSFFEEVKKIEVEAKLIDNLFREKEIDFERKDLLKNEFLILNSVSPKSTALAFYSKGRLSSISKGEITCFGIKPKNSEQAFALHALLNPEIKLITIMGKAGTGKTILSLAAGLKHLKDKTFDQFYFTRQIISMGNKDIGYLPGDPKDKISPYMKGMEDNLSVISSIVSGNKAKIDSFKKAEKIFLEPLSYLRGRSLGAKFFIIDEAQNLTQKEVKAIITRAGEFTKIILIGDISQIDSPYLDERSNGLSYVISKMRGVDIYAHVTLVRGERSELAEIAGKLL